MSATTPPSVTALPTPPSTASPTLFDSAADAFLGALPTFQSDHNALAENVYSNAVDAASSAQAASTSAGQSSASADSAAANAVAAATSAGAPLWVSGTSYSIGNVCYSPANKRVYRRITAGAGTTDPANDPTNWKVIDTAPAVVIVSATSQTAVASMHYVLTNVAATTVTLPAAPASGDVVAVTVSNGLLTNVIGRNGKTIMGIAENMLIDNAYATIELRFLNNTWRLV